MQISSMSLMGRKEPPKADPLRDIGPKAKTGAKELWKADTEAMVLVLLCDDNNSSIKSLLWPY